MSITAAVPVISSYYNDLESVLEVYQKFRKSTLVGLPEKILHFTITETLQMAISECFQEVTKHEF